MQSHFISEIRKQCCRGLDVLAREDVGDHACSQHTCTIISVPTNLYVRRGAMHACSPYCKQAPRHAESGWHPKFKLSTIYFCKNSTQIHVCSLNCLKTNPYVVGGLQMCRISGRIYGSELVSPLITQYSKKSKHMYMDPYKLLRNGSSTIDCATSRFFIQAVKVVNLLLFSRHRMYAEKNKLLKMKLNARKKVLYYVKLSRQHRKRIIYTDLIRIYLYFMNVRHIYRGLVPEPIIRKKLERKYADRCIELWNILCKHSFMKKNQNVMKYFQVFVVSCLYLMKSGLPMNSVQIIPKDPHLESSLPEANQLDFYNIPKNTFTSIKNDIQLAIRTIIEEKKISPHVLVLK